MNIQGWFPLGLTGIYKVKIFCNGVLETGWRGNIYLCSRCWQMLSSWLPATNRHPFQRLLNIYQYTTACTPGCYFQSGLSPPKLPSHTVNCDCDQLLDVYKMYHVQNKLTYLPNAPNAGHPSSVNGNSPLPGAQARDLGAFDLTANPMVSITKIYLEYSYSPFSPPSISPLWS